MFPVLLPMLTLLMTCHVQRFAASMTILPRPQLTCILADLDDTLYENVTMQVRGGVQPRCMGANQ